jgi:pyrroline-5-carboxylate reductase
MKADPATARLGFIGAGAISADFVEGLVTRGATNPILVSPRSERIGADLAARFPTVRRAAANAEVVDGSDILFLAVRPSQVETALVEITPRPDRSCAAS